MSPELREPDSAHEMPLDSLKDALRHILNTRPVDGVTISGGEPTEQEEELMDLLAFLAQMQVDDVLLYTGLTVPELGGRLQDLMRFASVVCGPYNKEENDGLPLRGSANQEILFRDEAMREKYLPLLSGPRTVQPVAGAQELFLIGILDAQKRAQ